MRAFRDSHIRLLPALLAAALAVATPARAGDFDPYLVMVDARAEAESGVAAKDIALEQGQSRALEKLLARIASRDDLRRLPEPHAGLAGSLMTGLSIVSEHAGARSYRAEVAVRFSRDAVRSYLSARAVRFVDEPAPPILVVPVVLAADGPRWWQDAGDWRRALEAADLAEGLTPVRFPANSAEDRQERPERLLAADRVSLDTFRVRYRTQGVVVAALDLHHASGSPRLSLVGNDGAGDIERHEGLPDASYDTAARRVAAIVSERWKRVMGVGGAEVGMRPGAGDALTVRVLLHAGRAEWEDIRRRLRASEQFDGLRVEALSEAQANIVLWPRSTGVDLPRALRGYGLDLFRAGDAWLLQAY